MATGKALNGKPYAGNPHVRFDEGEVASAATPRRGSLLYNIRKMVAFAALLAATAAVDADTYQFIVSGYPAANVNYSAASSGTSLEARYRTWDESDGVALRSDKYHSILIFIK